MSMLFDDGEPPLLWTIPVTLVGQARYQATIRLCRVGQPVSLLREVANPYDSEAIIAVDDDGFDLGYISREAWIRDALCEPGARCTAWITSIDERPRTVLRLTLDVQLAGLVVGERRYAELR